MKNLPNKIYLNFGEMTKEEFEKEDYSVFTKVDEYAVTFCEDKVFENDVEYIRKNVVDNMLKTAEDHAYFAGSEDMREKMMEKAIEFFENSLCCYIGAKEFTIEHGRLEKDFLKAMSDNIKSE